VRGAEFGRDMKNSHITSLATISSERRPFPIGRTLPGHVCPPRRIVYSVPVESFRRVFSDRLAFERIYGIAFGYRDSAERFRRYGWRHMIYWKISCAGMTCKVVSRGKTFVAKHS
jgi:hypothetical protein